MGGGFFPACTCRTRAARVDLGPPCVDPRARGRPACGAYTPFPFGVAASVRVGLGVGLGVRPAKGAPCTVVGGSQALPGLLMFWRHGMLHRSTTPCASAGFARGLLAMDSNRGTASQVPRNAQTLGP